LTQWYLEVRDSMKEAPILFVGSQIELREERKIIAKNSK
jgi:hypothetical protein